MTDDWFQPNSENPVQRGFLGAAITLTFEDASEMARPAVELARSVTDGEIRVEESDVGWGGNADAVVLVLEDIALVGGVGATLKGTWTIARSAGAGLARLLRTLRKSEESPSTPNVSLGSAAYLCMADLQDRVNGEVAGIELVVAQDLTDQRRPEQSFSGGGEPFLFLFANEVGSWLYLVSSHGVLLHRSTSGPLPFNPFWHGGAFDPQAGAEQYLDEFIGPYDQDED